MFPSLPHPNPNYTTISTFALNHMAAFSSFHALQVLLQWCDSVEYVTVRGLVPVFSAPLNIRVTFFGGMIML